LVGWHCGAATQHAGVQRCACIGPPPLHPPSASFIAITSVCPYLLRTGETGWRGVGEGPNLPYPVSRYQSRTSVNDAHPWKLYTPPGIHVRRQCGDVTYVCHSIRWTDRDNAERTAVDIKAHTPLIQFVVDLLLVCCI